MSTDRGRAPTCRWHPAGIGFSAHAVGGVAFLVGCALLVGCAEGEGPASGGPVLQDLDLPRWELVEAFRFGTAEVAGQVLTEIGQVLIGRDVPWIVVSQPEERLIRLLDQSGEIVGTLGGAGSGPGEFRNIHGLGWLGDTLTATDHLSRRVTLFSLDGTVHRVVSRSSEVMMLPDGGFLTASAPQALTPDGAGILWPALGFAAPDLSADGTVEMRFDIPILRIELEGEAVDTIAFHREVLRSYSIPWGGVTYRFPDPFPPRGFTALSPVGAGVVSVQVDDPPERGGAGFTVQAITPLGDTAFVRRIRVEPESADDQYLEEAAREARLFPADRENVPGPSEILRVLRSEGAHLDVLAPATDVVHAQDGSIWIRREVRPAGVPVEWLSLNPTGGPTGTVSLLGHERVAAVEGDFLVAIGKGDHDVPYLVAYRIER